VTIWRLVSFFETENDEEEKEMMYILEVYNSIEIELFDEFHIILESMHTDIRCNKNLMMHSVHYTVFNFTDIKD